MRSGRRARSSVTRPSSSWARSRSSAPVQRTSFPKPRPCPSRSTSSPIADSNEEIARLADLIEGVAGEWSPFEQQHGFSIDGVDLSTVLLVDGWRDRLVKVQNANTAAPTGEPRFTGWCLDGKISASPSSAHSARRTATSSPRSSTLNSSTATSSRRNSGPCPLRTGPRLNGRSRGWRPDGATRDFDPRATGLTIGLGVCWCVCRRQSAASVRLGDGSP